VPALSRSLAAALVGLAALGVAYTAYTQVVAAGLLDRIDLRLAVAMAAAWRPAVQPFAQAVAVLGGVEVTALAAIGLAAYLWRHGFRPEAGALLVVPLAALMETITKWLLPHPPPLGFAHPDGPSLVTMWHGGTLTFGGSYPSGHMMRTVLIYGLGAFVVRRLAAPGWTRTLAAPMAAVVMGLMALDRVYLGVHWQSDVVGGLLLGGAALAGAIVWLDRPRAAV
jgi:membrane-associated phospholipid phosphatase